METQPGTSVRVKTYTQRGIVLALSYLCLTYMHTNIQTLLQTAKPIARCSGFWVMELRCGSECNVRRTKTLTPSIRNPPWIISCSGTLHLDAGPLQHSSPCVNSIAASLALCPSLWLSRSTFLLPLALPPQAPSKSLSVRARFDLKAQVICYAANFS